MNGIISANTLFHFTKYKENLLGILENGFYPRCCMENLEFVYEPKYRGGFAPTEIAIPMVCFCDTPLSQISKHIKDYGGYALGMCKRWGESKGINPVMYELGDSNPIKSIRTALDKTIKYMIGQYVQNDDGDQIKEIGDKLIYFSCFIKPYEGNKWDEEKKEFVGESTRFYNEREWRYVPSFEELRKKSIPAYIRKDIYIYKEAKDDYTNKLKDNFVLTFKPNDLKYIIVSNEDEILEIANKVLDIKGRNGYDDDEKKILLTKIISIDKLRDDI